MKFAHSLNKINRTIKEIFSQTKQETFNKMYIEMNEV